jgi:hypothetical protein
VELVIHHNSIRERRNIMEFGKAFSFPFEDQEWFKKVAILALISLIPIVGPFVSLGWGVEITRRVIRKDPTPLPAFENFGGMLVDGLKVAVIIFVYMLPIILVQACNQGITFGLPSLIDDYDTVGTITMVTLVCFGCLSLLYAILMGFMLPAAIGNFAASDQMGAAFKFGKVFGLVRAAPIAYLLVLLGTFLSGIVAMLGVIACAIGVFFTAVYAAAINAHLQGQAYLAAGGDAPSAGDAYGDPNVTVLTS